MLHVVVVGGGPAGLVAAETLAKSGLRTTLVEPHPERHRPCTGLVTHAVLAELGLEEAALDHRLQEVALVSPTQRAAFLDLTASGKAAGVLTPASLLSVLRRRVIEAGVTCVTGRFKRFRHGEGDYPIVEIATGGEPLVLECDVVIAADGVASRVARALRLPPLERGVVYQERLSLLPGRELPSPGTMQVFLGRKVSADLFGFVQPQGEQVVVGLTTHARYGKRVWDNLAELKRRAGTSLELARPVKREAYCHPVKPRPSLVADRVLFVGDAAGVGLPGVHDTLFLACKSGLMAAQTIVRNQHLPTPERLAEYSRDFLAAYHPLMAGDAKLQQTFFINDRRREALLELAWDRDAQRAAVDAFLDKRRFAPPAKVQWRLKARVWQQLLRSSVGGPRRHEPDPGVKLPANENYLDLALRTPTGPLRLPAEAPVAERVIEAAHEPAPAATPEGVEP